MPTQECFALLDDASDATPARSRLYTGLSGELVCQSFDAWPAVLAEMQAALGRGLHAVPLLSYELGGKIVGVEPHPSTSLAHILLFERCELLDHAQVAIWLAVRADGEPAGIAGVHANVDEAEFTRALGSVHDYIAAGDTYQVNYTYRLRFDAFGSLFDLYARLRARQPVPYGALVALPDGSAIVSLSPELFVRHSQGELTTRPMKGTAPAASDDAENARRSAALAQDPKNRAENLMIVDLLRNDLGRVAVTGTVEVPALFDVQRYSSVLQMTSTVRARLRPDAALSEIFDALYPCGSITGAPKRRTMEIIRELEPAPRGIYTGAIGWFAPDGDFCLSVPIRTLVLQAPQHGVRAGELGVGAGIVFDSDARDEYAECQLKARFLTGLSNDFELFETMYADHEGVRHLPLHLARLEASARYFGFPFGAAPEMPACAAPTRLRLSLDQSGAFKIQTAALVPLDIPVRVLLADDATQSDDLFLRHKTSVRTRYDGAWRAAVAQGAFDTLFFNERGELTEGGRSNVLAKIDGEWYTPPLSCGLLPGIMRSVLAAKERIITRAELLAAQEVMLCNSLRGAMPALVVS
ncbi:MAG: aminodeoxychorismate synthase component I [Pseudomonadota bacterium]